MYRFILFFTLIFCLIGNASAQFQSPVPLNPGDSASLVDPLKAQAEMLYGEGAEVPVYDVYYDGDSLFMASLNGPQLSAIAADLEARGFVYEPEMSRLSRIGVRAAEQTDTTVMLQFQAMFKTADSLLKGMAIVQYMTYGDYTDQTPHWIQFVYATDPGDSSYSKVDMDDTVSVWTKFETVTPDPPGDLTAGD